LSGFWRERERERERKKERTKENWIKFIYERFTPIQYIFNIFVFVCMCKCVVCVRIPLMTFDIMVYIELSDC